MAQRYIPEVRLGDKRLIVLNGEPIGGTLRVPRDDEHRGNIHVGGNTVKAPITPRDREICRILRPRLEHDGLYFVGLDIIGDYLTEVNVTSPTGVQEIDRLDGVNLEAKVIDFVESQDRKAGTIGGLHRLARIGSNEGSASNAYGGQVAQSVEQRTENPCVGGSIPPLPTNFKRFDRFTDKRVSFTGNIADAARKLGSLAPADVNQSVLEIILLFGTFAIFAIFGLHGMTDGKYSMLVSENILYRHTFAFDEASMPRLAPFARPGYRENGYPYQIEVIDGKVLYGYPVGSSVLSLPLVALMNFAGISARTPDGHYNEAGDQVIQAAIAALLMAVLTLVFFRTALLMLPLSWSVVLAVGAAFGTQIWSTASRVLWSHTWQIFLVGIVIPVLLAQEERQARGRPILLGTLLSWAYFVRPTSSIPIMAVTAYILILRRSEFRTFAITGALWLTVFVFYSMRVFGQPLQPYYLFHLSPQHVWIALAGNFISPSRGLFVFVPGAAFVLFLVGYYWRELSHRWLAFLALFVIAVHTVIVSTDPNWWGGHCYGARMTTDVIPWFFLLAVLGCRCLLEEARPRFKHYAIALGLLTLVIGAAMNGNGALSHSANDWVNGGPNDVDQKPSRVWDWRHPQFLS